VSVNYLLHEGSGFGEGENFIWMQEDWVGGGGKGWTTIPFHVNLATIGKA